MKILDCESVESAYASMERIFSAPRSAINQAFEYVERHPDYRDSLLEQCPPDDLALHAVIDRLGVQPQCDRVCWFHITRALPTQQFAAGILPLNESLPLLWSLLRDVSSLKLPGAEWQRFQDGIAEQESHWADLYTMKTRGDLHWGPWAVLVRDVARKPQEFHAVAFFKAPEIVEDICLCFRERHGHDLLSDFQAATHPCIVKFVAEEQRGDAVGAALQYLYATHLGQRYGMHCNTCFSGKGRPIERAQILKIEFPASGSESPHPPAVNQP